MYYVGSSGVGDNLLWGRDCKRWCIAGRCGVCGSGL